MTALSERRASAEAVSALPETAVVLGARNLGGAIARDLLNGGVKVAGIARTRESLGPVGQAGALTLQADATDPRQLERAFGRAAHELGSLELIVNAMSPAPRVADPETFGGGPVARWTGEGFDDWALAPARLSFGAIASGTRALSEGGTFVQVVGAPARAPSPGRGLLSAGFAAVRTMTAAAAQELRASGIHVALLIVDGVIESPKTERMTREMPRNALVTQDDVAAAVRYLASQTTRGLTHELVITPSGAGWRP